MEKTTSFHKVTSSKSFVLILVLVLVLVVFWLINPNYLGWQNIKNILYATSLSGTLAVGIGCMLISGSPDLSAGAVGMAIVIAKSAESMARQTEASGKINSAMMLGLVFIETTCIYALIAAILVIFVL